MTEQELNLRKQLLTIMGQAKESGVDQLDIVNASLRATAIAVLADASMSKESRTKLEEMMWHDMWNAINGVLNSLPAIRTHDELPA